jgi:hypothetical protein
VLAKGPEVPFTAGSPIVAWGPEIEGFRRLIGRGLFTHGRFNCTGSLRRGAQCKTKNGSCCCCRLAGLREGPECRMVAGKYGSVASCNNATLSHARSPRPLLLRHLAAPPATCRPVVQECVRPGSIDTLAQLCLQDSSCEAFIFKPGAWCASHTVVLSCFLKATCGVKCSRRPQVTAVAAGAAG